VHSQLGTINHTLSLLSTRNKRTRKKQHLIKAVSTQRKTQWKTNSEPKKNYLNS